MADDEARAAAVLQVVAEGRTVAHHRLDGRQPCDLAVVDRLLRLLLEAKRKGWAVQVTKVRADLAELVDLVGVTDLTDLTDLTELTELTELAGPAADGGTTGTGQASRRGGRPNSAKRSG